MITGGPQAHLSDNLSPAQAGVNAEKTEGRRRTENRGEDRERTGQRTESGRQKSARNGLFFGLCRLISVLCSQISDLWLPSYDPIFTKRVPPGGVSDGCGQRAVIAFRSSETVKGFGRNCSAPAASA